MNSVLQCDLFPVLMLLVVARLLQQLEVIVNSLYRRADSNWCERTILTVK